MRQAQQESPREGALPSSHPQLMSMALKGTQESWRNMASGQPIPRRERSGPSEMLVGVPVISECLEGIGRGQHWGQKEANKTPGLF